MVTVSYLSYRVTIAALFDLSGERTAQNRSAERRQKEERRRRATWVVALRLWLRRDDIDNPVSYTHLTLPTKA